MGGESFAIRFRTATEAWTTLTITDVSKHGDLCGTVLDGLTVAPVCDR